MGLVSTRVDEIIDCSMLLQQFISEDAPLLASVERERLNRLKSVLDAKMQECSLDNLVDCCYAVCQHMGWKRDWQSGGVYLHLESSEFIEALRGKGTSTPLTEAGDVLFVLLSMCKENYLSIAQLMDKLRNKCAKIVSSNLIVHFEKGTLNPSIEVFNEAGKLVCARSILVGDHAWLPAAEFLSGASPRPLGKRLQHP